MPLVECNQACLHCGRGPSPPLCTCSMGGLQRVLTEVACECEYLIAGGGACVFVRRRRDSSDELGVACCWVGAARSCSHGAADTPLQPSVFGTISM